MDRVDVRAAAAVVDRAASGERRAQTQTQRAPALLDVAWAGEVVAGRGRGERRGKTKRGVDECRMNVERM